MNKQIEISEEITEAKSEYKLRVNPTFVFFVISVGNPKPRAQT